MLSPRWWWALALVCLPARASGAQGSQGRTPPDRRTPAALAPVVVRPDTVVPGLPGVTTVGAAPTLSQATLRMRPQPLDDLFRSLGRLPGTVGADQSARVAVRGAAPMETGVMLDGMLLSDPYHVKDFDGGLSVIATDLVERVTLLSGALPIAFGNQLGGMVLLEPARIPTSAPSRTLPDATLNAGLTGLRVTLSHAVPQTPSAWVMSVRRGWVDAAVHAAGADGDIRPLFQDGYARYTRWFQPNLRLSVHALASSDDFTLKTSGAPALRSLSADKTGWATLEHDNTVRHTTLTLGLTRNSVQRAAQGVTKPMDRSSLLEDRLTRAMSARWLTVWRVHPDWQLQAGGEGWIGRTIAQTGLYLTGTAPPPVPRDARRGARGALWLGAQAQLTGTVAAEFGVRGERWSWAPGGGVAPRAAITWRPLGMTGTTVQLASGILRSGLPLERRPLGDGDSTTNRVVRATVHSLSVTQAVGATHWQVELYRRTERGDGARWINASAGLTPAPELEPDRMRLPLTGGSAWGIEAGASGRLLGMTWQASLTRATARDHLATGITLPRPWDVQDAAAVDLARMFGAWSVAVGWMWHSGWPVSNAVVQEIKGQTPRLVWPVLFGARTPVYRRVDLRVARTFTIARVQGRAYLDLFNALNNTNVRGVNESIGGTTGNRSVRRNWETLLPRLPAAGVSLTF